MSPLEGLDREQLNKLDKEMLIELLLNALGRISQLEKQVAVQAITIQKLQDELAKNSSNSSKPPSSDGLKKPKTRSLRKKGQRPIGGQAGHKGNTLKMVNEPDYIELHSVTRCPHCQIDLLDTEPTGHEKRQLFDVPPVRLEVTEHQVEVKECPGCGQQAKGRFPAHVTQPTQYGARLKAQASYLNNYHFIPLERTEELLTDFYGQSPSEAAVITANNRLVTQIDPALEAIRERLIASDVAHFDESGLAFAPSAVGRRLNPYPVHYRQAFAFSILLYPHHYRLALRLAFLLSGVIRVYHVPLDDLDGLGLVLPANGATSAANEYPTLALVRFPFGPSLSACLACSL